MQHNNIYVYTRMKIINSHYIPLPEPHNVIMGLDEDEIAEQIGVLSVVEEDPDPDGGYGIITHEHPVVRTLGQNAVVSEDKENINFMVTVETAEGKVWYHLENKDCLVVCPAQRRKIPSFQLNLLMMSQMMHTGADYDPLGMLHRLKENGIEVEWDEKSKENHQEIVLSNMEIGGKFYLQSLLLKPLFLVYFADVIDEQQIQPLDDDDIFFEFVNQARAMLEVNPHYEFHFTTLDQQMSYMADRLNKELNDYLERPDESE